MPNFRSQVDILVENARRMLRRLRIKLASRYKMAIFRIDLDIWNALEHAEQHREIEFRLGNKCTDYDSLVALYPREFGYGNATQSVGKLITHRFDTAVPSYVAVDKHRGIIGFCWCPQWTNDCLLPAALRASSKGSAEVCNLFVKPSYRNRGIARQLLVFALANLKASGVGEVFSCVSINRLASLRMHARLGFVLLGYSIHGNIIGKFYHSFRDWVKLPKGAYRIHPVAIVGGDSPNTLALAKALGRMGVPIHILAPDPVTIVSKSRYVKSVTPLTLADKNILERELVAFTSGFSSAERRPLLIFTNEKQIEACSDLFETVEKCFQPVTNIRKAYQYVKKDSQLAQAQSAGFSVPRSTTVTSVAELKECANIFTFPVIVKPNSDSMRGEYAEKAEIIHNSIALLNRIRCYLQGGLSDLLIQEYIPGNDNCILAFLSACDKQGSPLASITAKKNRQCPPGAGVMTSGRTEKLPDFSIFSKRLCEILEVDGLIGIEAKVHNVTGELFFIEINVRNEAIVSLAVEAGVNLPFFAYLNTLREPLLVSQCQRDLTWVNVIDDFQSARQLVRMKRLTWREYISSMRGPKTFAYYAIDDPIPFIYLLFTKMFKKFYTCVRRRLISL